MAQAVTIQHGDTITGILKTQKSVQDHELFAWKHKLNRLNPHISNLDRIYPGESVLIPDTLNEIIAEQQIWRNAFCKIPKALQHSYHGPTEIYFAQPGDTIDKVAQYMFASGPYRTISASSKRALLLHNNPFLINHLHTNRIPVNKLVNITPAVLSEVEKKHWQLQRTPLKAAMDQMGTDTRDMFKQAGAEPTTTVSRAIEIVKEWGATVGMDDVVRVSGYGSATVSGYATAGAMSIGAINTLARELYAEAVEKFGVKVVCSTKANHLAKVQQFIKGHPKYDRLIRHMRELPRHLLPKTDFLTVNPKVNSPVARQFRKHITMPLKKYGNPTKYVGSVAKQLNGRLRVLKGVGKGATWYVPAALGAVSVMASPPEMRMRAFFEEGFGLLGGALGTWLGGTALSAGAIGLFALCGLCLGPFGIFVIVFICASAGGIIGMELFRKGGAAVYDFGAQLGSGRIYHSPDQLLEHLK